jgi:hypothetical protein
VAPGTRAFLAGLLLLGSASVTSCGAPGAETTRIEPAYDPSTGRLQLLKFDSNGDGKVDTWSYMDGTKVIRIEIDSNHDAMLDRWEYYDAGGGIEKIGTSRRQDGSPDSWAYYAHDGSIVRIELSTRRDGKVDRTEYYQQGALVRAEEDTSGDGQIDKWETYDGKRLTSVAFDTIHRGYPDRRLVYGLDGAARVDVLGPPPVRP